MSVYDICLIIFVFLQILRLGGIAYFLSRLMDPPSDEAVSLSIKHLMELVIYFLFLTMLRFIILEHVSHLIKKFTVITKK